MDAVQILLRDAGGLIKTAELHRAGFGRARISDLVAAGRLSRVRKGWYGSPDLPPDLRRAARIGGRTTCVSAAVQLGLWVPRTPDVLHVAVAPSACQLRRPSASFERVRPGDARIHWSDDATTYELQRGSRLLAPPGTMLRHVAACADLETLQIIAESALGSGLITRRGLEVLLDNVNAGARVALASASPLSGSGTESIFARRIRRLGVPLRQQVDIGPDRVDFVVGDRLVVEVDSRTWHDPLKDARRDARLGALGYRVLRFRYEQVMSDWPSVQRAVLAAIRRGDHLH